jgi:hypothetical protein
MHTAYWKKGDRLFFYITGHFFIITGNLVPARVINQHISHYDFPTLLVKFGTFSQKRYKCDIFIWFRKHCLKIETLIPTKQVISSLCGTNAIYSVRPSELDIPNLESGKPLSTLFNPAYIFCRTIIQILLYR